MESACTLEALRELILKGVDRKLTTAEIEDMLSVIVFDESDYLGYVLETTETYYRNSIARSQFAELLVITWLPGQASPIHDHAGSNCGIRVLKGRLTETFYQAAETETNVAVKVAEDVWGPGMITSAAVETIHKVTNAERGERLVSLHIYSPPLRLDAMKIYIEGFDSETETDLVLSTVGVV